MQDNSTTNRATRKALRKVRWAYAQSLRGLARPPMAHHALMIELADGNWWLVDPYLRTMYALPNDEEWAGTAGQLDIKRQHVVHVSDPADSSLDRYRTRLRVLHTTLLYMLSLIDARYTAKSLELELPVVLACAFAYGQHRHTKWSDELRDQLIEVSAKPDTSDAEFLTDASYAYHWALAPRYGNDAPLESPELDRRILDSRRNRELEQRVSWRIVALFLHIMLEFTDHMHRDPLIKRHRSYEIASPALMLGVATLNHLSSHKPEVRLGGKLAAMSSSQWILADSLAAKQRGDAPEETYNRLMADRLSQYNQLPTRRLVPPLRHLGK